MTGGQSSGMIDKGNAGSEHENDTKDGVCVTEWLRIVPSFSDELFVEFVEVMFDGFSAFSCCFFLGGGGCCGCCWRSCYCCFGGV